MAGLRLNSMENLHGFSVDVFPKVLELEKKKICEYGHILGKYLQTFPSFFLIYIEPAISSKNAGSHMHFFKHPFFWWH